MIRVLLADDEPLVRTGIAMILGAEADIEVVAAVSDGSAAIRAVRELEPDVVVMDVRMPGMDGPTFHEHLRRERPGLAARTVFITGDVAAGSGRMAGVKQPVLPKPFAFEKLEETLVAVMRGTPITARVGWP